MKIFECFFNKNLKYNFINKFNYKTFKKLFNFKKIILNLKSNAPNLKLIAIKLLIVELLTNKKAHFLVLKKQSLILKIKSGSFIGCKVVLKKKIMFNFLKRLVLQLFLKKIHKLNFNKNIILVNFSNIILFFNLKKFIFILNEVKNLNLIVVTNNNFGYKVIFFNANVTQAGRV